MNYDVLIRGPQTPIGFQTRKPVKPGRRARVVASVVMPWKPLSLTISRAHAFKRGKRPLRGRALSARLVKGIWEVEIPEEFLDVCGSADSFQIEDILFGKTSLLKQPGHRLVPMPAMVWHPDTEPRPPFEAPTVMPGTKITLVIRNVDTHPAMFYAVMFGLSAAPVFPLTADRWGWPGPRRD